MWRQTIQKSMVLGGLLGLAALPGCMSMPQLNAQSAQVRLLEQEPAESCVYLGELSGYVMRYYHTVDVLDAREKAFAAYEIELKNKVAAMHGNTAVLLARRNDGDMFYDVHSVYQCK